MIKIYIAGSLFSEADIAQRIKEANLLRELLSDVRVRVDIYNPIEAPVNDKSKLPTAEDIFNMDVMHLLTSDYVLADLTTLDTGVAMELGMYINKEGRIFAHNSDIRLGNANKYEGLRIPHGLNQFVMGGLYQHKHKVHTSSTAAIHDLVSTIINKHGSTR